MRRGPAGRCDLIGIGLRGIRRLARRRRRRLRAVVKDLDVFGRHDEVSGNY
jgi:hypothetical protein